MALGIFKKIKDGFKKVIGGIKKGAQWLGNSVLKPIVNDAAPIQTAVNVLINLTTLNRYPVELAQALA